MGNSYWHFRGARGLCLQCQSVHTSSLECLIPKMKSLWSTETSATVYQLLYFVDRASRHRFLLITNSMHFFMYLFISSLYMFRASSAQHQEIKLWTLFYYQLMHTTLKNAELLKHSKLDKNTPTCFGLHRNHLQGAKVSAWLKITRLVTVSA